MAKHEAREPEGLRTIHSREEDSAVRPGEAVLCGYPVSCSACESVADDRSVYSAGQVVLANITTHPDGWHGWWSCSGPGSREHWERGAIKRRLDATGSVTP